MEKSKKIVKLDPLLLKDLWSGEQTPVLKTLKKLRSAGNIGYVPEILKLLNQPPGELIRKELVQFLSDIKKPAVIPFILAGLKDPELKGARASIISACWQSGLDYSHDLPLFVQLFLEGDYATSLEAFTLIEESVLDLGREEINAVLTIVQKGMDKQDEAKKPLTMELVKILQE